MRVRGRSMWPTLRAGDVLLTRPPGRRLAVGDVVLVAPTERGPMSVKRIAAGPRDVVEIEAGRLYVNDRPWDGRPRVAGARVLTWRVPDGHYFVVGDNLRESTDSRVWTQPFVPASRIGGVAVGRWPWRRLAPRRGDATRTSAAPR